MTEPKMKMDKKYKTNNGGEVTILRDHGLELCLGEGKPAMKVFDCCVDFDKESIFIAYLECGAPLSTNDFRDMCLPGCPFSELPLLVPAVKQFRPLTFEDLDNHDRFILKKDYYGSRNPVLYRDGDWATYAIDNSLFAFKIPMSTPIIRIQQSRPTRLPQKSEKL